MADMKFSKPLSMASLGILLLFGGPASAQSGDQLVTLCFRGRTIQVPFYLQSRYTANGATIGPCAAAAPASPPKPKPEARAEPVPRNPLVRLLR